jgi:hypothetical protein
MATPRAFAAGPRPRHSTAERIGGGGARRLPPRREPRCGSTGTEFGFPRPVQRSGDLQDGAVSGVDHREPIAGPRASRWARSHHRRQRPSWPVRAGRSRRAGLGRNGRTGCGVLPRGRHHLPIAARTAEPQCTRRRMGGIGSGSFSWSKACSGWSPRCCSGAASRPGTVAKRLMEISAQRAVGRRWGRAARGHQQRAAPPASRQGDPTCCAVSTCRRGGPGLCAASRFPASLLASPARGDERCLLVLTRGGTVHDASARNSKPFT